MVAAVQRVAKGLVGASISIGSGDGWNAPAAGNLIVISANSDATVTISAPSGTSAGPSVVDGNGAYTWYKIAAGTETTITATPGSSADIVLTVCEYSGISAFDASNSSTIASSSGNTTNAAAVSTSADGDLLIGFGLLHNELGASVPASVSWSNGLSPVLAGDSGTASSAVIRCASIVGELLSAGAAGSYSSVASWTNNYGDRQHVFLAFKASGTADAPVPFGYYLAPGQFGPVVTLFPMSPIADQTATSASADASLPVTATIASTGQAARPVDSALSVTATIGATSAAARPADSSLAVTASVTSTADRTALVAASVAVTATLTASALLSAVLAASLPVTATLAASATDSRTAAAVLSVTATLTATADRATFAAAALPVTATLTAIITADRFAAASLVITASTSASTSTVAIAALPVTATPAAAMSRAAPADAALAVTVTLASAGARTALVAGSLSVTFTGSAGLVSLASIGATLAVAVTFVATALTSGAATPFVMLDSSPGLTGTADGQGSIGVTAMVEGGPTTIRGAG